MSVLFKKITNASLKDMAIRDMENKILSGGLQPGERLPPERELAAAMGISRSLVNLCLLELESKGFVRIVPRQGTFVNDFKKKATPQMLMSIMNYECNKLDWTLFNNLVDTRILLECECTRLAVKNTAFEVCTELKEALKQMEDHYHPEAFINGNFQFHSALTIASGNTVLAMIFNSFEAVIRLFLRLFFTTPERCEESYGIHKTLYQALVEQNEEEAVKALKLTLGIGAKGLADIFKL